MLIFRNENIRYYYIVLEQAAKKHRVVAALC